MAHSEEESQDLTTKLETSANAYDIEIGTVKSKILVNSTTPTTPTNMKMSGETLEEVETSTLVQSSQKKVQARKK